MSAICVRTRGHRIWAKTVLSCTHSGFHLQLHCYQSGFVALVPQFLPCRHKTCLHSVQHGISSSGRTIFRVALLLVILLLFRLKDATSILIGYAAFKTLSMLPSTPPHTYPSPPSQHYMEVQLPCNKQMTLTSTSALHPRTTEMMSILERAGSRGNSTMLRPSGVSDPVLSSAPSTHSWYMEFMMLSCNTVSTVTTQSAC